MSRQADAILEELAEACGSFAAAAARSIDSRDAERLRNGEHFIVVRCKPGRARLVVRTEEGTVVVYEAAGVHFPAALGEASAKCIQEGLRQLTANARASVQAILASGRGGGLGLVCERDGAVRIILDADVEQVELARLQPAEQTLH